jgi:ribosome-binding factor A
MKTQRLARVNEEIMKETANILRTEIRDPRIDLMVSVTKADTTNDLKICKVYVSVLGDEQKKKEVLKGLKSSGGFIRQLLARRLELRNTPELIFVLDDSIEYGMRMNKLISDIAKDLPPQGENE